MCHRRAWVPYFPTIAVCCLLILLLAGCFVADTMNQTSSPDLKILLQDFSAQVVPGHSEALFLIDPPLDDEAFAAATPHIRAYRPRELYLDTSRMTDASVPNLMQLDSVNILQLGETPIRAEALKPLATLPNLVIVNAWYPDKQERAIYEEEMGDKAWLYGGRTIDSRVVEYGLSRRVTMLSATKVAWKVFKQDLAEFIHGLTMPP
jgi:hypothetical protein